MKKKIPTDVQLYLIEVERNANNATLESEIGLANETARRRERNGNGTKIIRPLNPNTVTYGQ